MKKPNFFIIGAPKCGTTSLYEYLRTHPQIFLSDLKEPHYFADDFGDRFRSFTDERSYLERCFADAREDHVAVGEASAAYLYSKNAVANIRKFNPDARLIVMLRNPADMVYAVHSELVYGFSEDERDFAKAWSLQDERKAGRRIPQSCPVPAFLQYKDFASFGEQLRRVYALFPREQVKVVFLEDIRINPAQVYAEVLAFLGLRPDGRKDFPVANASKRHRVEWLSRSIRRLPPGVVRAVRAMKRVLGLERVGLVEIVDRLNRLESDRKPLPENMRREIIEALRPDIDLLERLTGRNLSGWKGGSLEDRKTGT